MEMTQHEIIKELLVYASRIELNAEFKKKYGFTPKEEAYDSMEKLIEGFLSKYTVVEK